MIKKFIKKTMVIEAVQWTGKNDHEILSFLGYNVPKDKIVTLNKPLELNTLNGMLQVSINDWIIKGVKGEVYPCKPDIFSETYEG